MTPILAHSEKAAAYMADGYARIAGRPGVCMAQAVGAANLASGLQDPFLGRTPVVALTGRKPPSFQHRNAYQEIPHAPLFAAVTKFSTTVDLTSELPRLIPPCLARCLGGHAAPDPSRFFRPSGGRDRARPDCRTAGSSIPRRRRIPAHRADGRHRRHRPRRRSAYRRSPRRDRRRRRGRRLAGRAGDSSRSPRRCRRRSPRPSGRAASSRPAIGSLSGSPAAIPRRRPTASCTAPIWSCLSAAIPATRSP